MEILKSSFKIGDIVEGEVTGIQQYGIFVKLSDKEQGLIHISECDHGYVTQLDQMAQIGERVKVQVIDIDEYTHKISLSLRTLHPINIPPFPAKLKRKKYRVLPRIGFSSIRRAMPFWIKEGLHAVETDEANLFKKKK